MSANQLVDEITPGIGHNLPPLDEQIAEVIAPLKMRQAAGLAVALTARIVDQPSAEKVLDLDRQLKAIEDDMEVARKELKAPYLAACRLIDGRFDAVTGPLRTARTDCRGMIGAWQRQQEARARAERERLQAEQRRAEAEAEAARRAAQENRAAGSVNVADELSAMQAEEQARRLAERAAAVRVEPLRSATGTAGVRREITFTVTDLRKCLGWMLKQHGIAGQLEQAVRTILGKYLRGLGVQTVERGIEIPGVATGTEKVATVRS